MTPLPTMFIGSSAEGLKVARALQTEMHYDVEATIWSQGVFGLSDGTLETLTRVAHDFDFAVLILTPDDVVVKRDIEGLGARDNVLFEAGLFMGALGRDRVYFVASPDDGLTFPSDLAGVTIARYRDRRDENLQAALGPVAEGIRRAMVNAVPQVSDSIIAPAVAAIARSSGPSSSETAPADGALLGSVEAMIGVLETGAVSAPLRGDQGTLYAALVEEAQRERPDEVLIRGLSVPRETSMKGIYATSVGEALTALGLIRTVLKRPAA